jgi:hypothetical protein
MCADCCVLVCILWSTQLLLPGVQQATAAAVAERQSSEIEQLKNALVRLESEKRDIMLEVSTSTT